MGLFDKFTGRSSSDAPLDKAEGFAAIMLAVVAADGDISDEEAEDFTARAARMRLFADMSGSPFHKMIEKLCRILKRETPEDLIKRAVPALTPELRETAFVVAVDMVFADGSVEDEEKELVEKLQAELGISDDLAAKILDVMILKHRG